MADDVTVANGAGGTRPPQVLPPQVLVVFEVSGTRAAFPIQNVERIVPMARLSRPPSLPPMLEGILNLGGAAIPVLRLDRLFQLPEQSPGLYSMLIVINDVADGPLAVMVDRVDQIVTVAETAAIPVAARDSLNGCAEATVTLGEELIHLLSPARTLLATERKALSEFQKMTEHRLRDWEFHET